jgi:hypothetical protein
MPDCARKFLLSLTGVFFYFISTGQVHRISDSSMVFSGTRIAERSKDFDSSGHFSLSGYVSVYYGVYSDSSRSGFQKFPTISPRSNEFGLNIIMLSMKYSSERFRGIASLHYGDIPLCAWSPKFNAIQEANIGVRVHKRLWLDAGFFRTHIGLESIQPRENIALSLATTTYYEPYFLAGAKLTYELNQKLLLQVNAFNSMGSFEETNKSKAYGFSLSYEPSPQFTISLNSITADEKPLYTPGRHQRIYNNFYAIYRRSRFNCGVDVNYAYQQNSSLGDSGQGAQLFSTLIAAKFKLRPKSSLYSRLEYYSDPDGIMTGPIENSHHVLVGLKVSGITLGAEYKPIPNSYIRLEGRFLHTKDDEDIFKPLFSNPNQRLEVLTGLGLWF